MSETYTPVSGGCYCGAVRYEAEADLEQIYFCHCRGCQRSTGTPAYTGVIVKADSFRYNRDEVTEFQTSEVGKNYFCKHCGSTIVWIASEHPEWTNIALGTLDHPEKVVPTKHTCVESQLPWYRILDNLPKERCDEDDG